MKLKAYKTETADNLAYSVEENLGRYTNKDFDWSTIDDLEITDFEIPDDLSQKMCECYNLDIFGNFIPDGNSFAKYDGKAAILLFQALQGLKPKDLAQHRLWVSLAHLNLMPYLRKRWPKIDNIGFNDIKYIKEHWLNKDKIRNWLKGLYWQVKCTAIQNEDGTWNYEYTDFLFTRQSLGNRGIAARPYLIANPILVKGTLMFLKKYENEFLSPNFAERAELCFQILNQEGAKIEYGTWYENDFMEMLYSHKEELEVLPDHKTAKKQREEELAARGIDVGALKQATKKKSKKKHKKRRR